MDQSRHDLAALRWLAGEIENRMVFARQILAQNVAADILATDPCAQMGDAEGLVHEVCLSDSLSGACSPMAGTAP